MRLRRGDMGHSMRGQEKAPWRWHLTGWGGEKRFAHTVWKEIVQAEGTVSFRAQVERCRFVGNQISDML